MCYVFLLVLSWLAKRFQLWIFMTLMMYYIGLYNFFFFSYVSLKLTYVVIFHMTVRIIMTIDEPILLMRGPWIAVLVLPRKITFSTWRSQGPKNADAHNFIMTAGNELSMRSSSWNITDSNKPILHLINRDPGFDIWHGKIVGLHMQEILDRILYLNIPGPLLLIIDEWLNTVKCHCESHKQSLRGRDQDLLSMKQLTMYDYIMMSSFVHIIQML